MNTQITEDMDFCSDPDLIAILIENLIQNAVDYHDPYKAECLINVSVDTDPWQQLRLEIADNGLGIDPNIKQHIFEMFFVGNERSHGTGLGLYEVKLIIEKLKGNIEFEQTSNFTKFKIVIPNTKMTQELEVVS